MDGFVRSESNPRYFRTASKRRWIHDDYGCGNSRNGRSGSRPGSQYRSGSKPGSTARNGSKSQE